ALRLAHRSLVRSRVTAPPFAPLGPLGEFPCLFAPMAALRFPLAPCRSLALARGSASQRSKRVFPSSSAILAVHAPGLRLRWNRRCRPPGSSPYVSHRRCCLPLPPRRRLPPLLRFRRPIPQPARSLSTLRGAGYPYVTQ